MVSSEAEAKSPEEDQRTQRTDPLCLVIEANSLLLSSETSPNKLASRQTRMTLSMPPVAKRLFS